MDGVPHYHELVSRLYAELLACFRGDHNLTPFANRRGSEETLTETTIELSFAAHHLSHNSYRSYFEIIAMRVKALNLGSTNGPQVPRRYRPSVIRNVLIFLLLSGSIVHAQDFGPVETRNHRSISLAFLRFEPRPNLLPPGDKRWSFSITSANDFRSLDGVEEDYEVQRLGILYREGLRNGLEWSVEVPFMSRGGGFQDPIIDWWHANVLKWSDNDRDNTRFGRSVVRVPDSEFSGSADGLGDISGTISKSLGRGWVGTAGIKIPTGSAGDLLGSGGFDAGVYLQARYPIMRKLFLHGQLGLVWQGDAKELDNARTLVHQEGISLVWQRNSRDAWIAQWQGEASALDSGVAESDRTHRLITIGFKRKLSSTQMLDLFFSEDQDVFRGRVPELVSTGPDFTMGIRFSTRF
jgi:hypothetical protein